MNDLFAKKSSRLTAVLLAALLLCMPLSSCGSQGGGTTEPTGETAAPTDGSSPAEETTATTAATTLPTQKDVSGEQTQTLGAVLVVGIRDTNTTILCVRWRISTPPWSAA